MNYSNSTYNSKHTHTHTHTHTLSLSLSMSLIVSAAACLFVGVTSAYTPSSNVENVHNNFPHITQQGTLTSNEFDTTKDYALSVLIFPAILFALSVLLFLLYGLFMCFRCCCSCLRCGVPTANDLDKAEKKIVLAKRAGARNKFLFVSFCSILASLSMLNGNMDLNKGIGHAVDALSNLEDWFGDLVITYLLL